MTFAVFIGKVPLEVLNDVAKASKTMLLGAEADVVLQNRTAARVKFGEVAKNAAKTYLAFVRQRELLEKIEVKK